MTKDYALEHKAADRLCAKLAKLETMTAGELKKLYDRLSADSSDVCTALINSGYGLERGSETRARAENTGDALARLYVKVNDALAAVVAEERARLRYQGNTHPIKRAS